MSPLIHKSMTWATVSSVVLMSGWLASSAQTARDMGGFRLRLAQQSAAPVAKAAPKTLAAHRTTAPAVQAQTPVQVVSLKR